MSLEKIREPCRSPFHTSNATELFTGRSREGLRMHKGGNLCKFTHLGFTTLDHVGHWSSPLCPRDKQSCLQICFGGLLWCLGKQLCGCLFYSWLLTGGDCLLPGGGPAGEKSGGMHGAAAAARPGDLCQAGTSCSSYCFLEPQQQDISCSLTWVETKFILSSLVGFGFVGEEALSLDCSFWFQ